MRSFFQKLAVIAAAAFAVAVLTADASAQSAGERLAYAQTAPGATNDYLLGAGDKVRVTVYGEDDLTGEYALDGNGMIALPLIGDVRAMGLSARALQTSIANAYSNGYLNNPRVAVEITTYRPFTIIGQVTRPGQYPYVNGMTVVNAVALAGGYTPQAADSYVYVRHEGETKEIRIAADAAAQIRPGDVVRVDETGFWTLMSVASPITAVLGAARYGLP